MHKRSKVHLPEAWGHFIQQAMDLLSAFRIQTMVHIWFVKHPIITRAATQMSTCCTFPKILKVEFIWSEPGWTIFAAWLYYTLFFIGMIGKGWTLLLLICGHSKDSYFLFKNFNFRLFLRNAKFLDTTQRAWPIRLSATRPQYESWNTSCDWEGMDLRGGAGAQAPPPPWNILSIFFQDIFPFFS